VQNFKEQGNNYLKGKWYREALGLYTQGLDAKPDDARLKEALLLNRAACNLDACVLPALLPIPSINVTYSCVLRLENYGSVLLDCASIIMANSCASKGYYRAGLALLALGRADEALDVCTRAGDGVADGAGFKTLRARAEKREELRRKEEERRERERRANEEKRKMDVAFAVRSSLLSSHSQLNQYIIAVGVGTYDRNEI